MARQRYIYREIAGGRVQRIPVSGVAVRRDGINDPFEQQMVRSYYELECEKGARFRPDWGHHTAREIKEAWAK